MSPAEQFDEEQLQQMTRELATFVVTQFRQAHPAMVMNALLSAYLNVARSSGRLCEVPIGVSTLVTHPAVLAAMGQKPENHSVH